MCMCTCVVLVVDAQPHSAVALEARAESHLQHPLPAPQLGVLADVVHLVPDGGGGGVAVCVQRIARGHDVLRAELEVFLHAVDDAAPARVDAEVVDAALEVRDEGGHLHIYSYIYIYYIQII
jgi:hypothetical protein